ncbi:MAG: ThiF family adenylyltransferase [Pyrinomonadaceae bacterium]
MKKIYEQISSKSYLPDENLFQSVMNQPLVTGNFPPTANDFQNSTGNHDVDMPNLIISELVLREIYQTVGLRRAENGGPLGGSRSSGIVTHYHFDNSAHRTGATYSPNAELLNKLFAEEWNPQDINLLGFVHSHPPGFRQPSGGDIEYASRILAAIPKLEYLYLPIVMTKPDTGSFSLLPFVALRDGETVKIKRIELVIVRDNDPMKVSSDSADEKKDSAISVMDTKLNNGKGKYSSEIFKRVENAYDLNYLSDCRVVVFGTGGAADFIENIVRAGVGQIILVDKDTVSESNLATQQTYLCGVGRPKVECIAERLLQINPQALTVAIPRWLNDDFDDEELAELLADEIQGRKPTRTLLCGLTDNFYAQARINRLALQFGVPSLCAQVYKEGRGAEITFTYPGVTPACHRCILSSRYRAFLEQNYQNEVTSHGTPIFATARLNAIKGFIALGLLHHGTDHPRWGNLLKRIGNRNLVQLRMDPDFTDTLGFDIFDRTFDGANTSRLLFDEAIWVEQKAECPANGYDYYCPDCSGTGDLGLSIGTLDDTRKMR